MRTRTAGWIVQPPNISGLDGTCGHVPPTTLWLILERRLTALLRQGVSQDCDRQMSTSAGVTRITSRHSFRPRRKEIPSKRVLHCPGACRCVG